MLPIFSLLHQIAFNGSNFLLFNHLNTSSNLRNFTASLWVTTAVSSSIFVSLGRTPSNFDGEFEIGVSGNVLNFWDNSYGAGFGQSGSSSSNVANGICSWLFWTLN